jgi:hypothetical protein
MSRSRPVLVWARRRCTIETVGQLLDRECGAVSTEHGHSDKTLDYCLDASRSDRLSTGADERLLGLAYFHFNTWTPYNWLLAMAIVVTIPPVIAFIFAQRQLIESGALTGMK